MIDIIDGKLNQCINNIMENEYNESIDLLNPPTTCSECGNNSFDIDVIEDGYMSGGEPCEKVVGYTYTCTKCGQEYNVDK